MDILAYLAQATPDDWHQVAWNWNWDAGTEPLQWIVRQPACDQGTALLIYWYGGPRYYAKYTTRDEVSVYLREGYDFLMEIERRYLDNAYTRQEIAFNPHADTGHSEKGFDWTAEYANLPNRRPIPEAMYEPSPGRDVECDPSFDEGLPPGVEL